jgi:DNA-directed RNA polymerase subunit K/omega
VIAIAKWSEEEIVCMLSTKETGGSMHVKDHESSAVLVEKCLKQVPDYFELVILLSYRAQEISSSALTVAPSSQSRSALMAMTEFADREVDPKVLREKVVLSFQQCAFLSHDFEE